MATRYAEATKTGTGMKVELYDPETGATVGVMNFDWSDPGVDIVAIGNDYSIFRDHVGEGVVAEYGDVTWI